MNALANIFRSEPDTSATLAAHAKAKVLAGGRPAKRSRFASVTQLFSTMSAAVARMSDADKAAVVALTVATRDALTMELLSRAIDGDEWANKALAMRGEFSGR